MRRPAPPPSISGDKTRCRAASCPIVRVRRRTYAAPRSLPHAEPGPPGGESSEEHELRPETLERPSMNPRDHTSPRRLMQLSLISALIALIVTACGTSAAPPATPALPSEEPSPSATP